MNGDAACCDRCATNTGSATVDLVGSMIYGCTGLESGALMHRYKQPQATPADTQLVATVTAIGLLHRNCADALVGNATRYWATVPSLKRIGEEHPFHRILLRLLDVEDEIVISASMASREATDAQRREVQPDFYDVQTPVSAGSHVMVIDDTWTTGGHAASVATALKHAGAHTVSVMTVARWLDPRGGYRRWTYTNDIRERQYDPSLCPWTAGRCPPSLAMSKARTSTRPTPIPWPGFSWDTPGRIAPACRMILDIVADGHWHRCCDITDRVATAFDLQTETVSKLLQGMVKNGGVDRRGRRQRGSADTREVRIL
ncbi:hypothetical protein AB0876_19275 [Mycobacterium sp. NPDC049093]